MRKKYIFALLLVILFLILLQTVVVICLKQKNNEEVKEIVVFQEDIQEVEIIDGTSGNRVNIVDADMLNEVQSIIGSTEFIIIPDEKESTGYKWRIIVKTTKDTIDILSSNQVTYNSKLHMFANINDYSKLEEFIISLYKKHEDESIN